ncbi:hypothetical protein SEA_LEOPARD_103 [Mycobacterium phage Leopard]|nr:hypothetical protein SEA_LEOPARD_103 [Mycobacterium phage Leopard]
MIDRNEALDDIIVSLQDRAENIRKQVSTNNEKARSIAASLRELEVANSQHAENLKRIKRSIEVLQDPPKGSSEDYRYGETAIACERSKPGPTLPKSYGPVSGYDTKEQGSALGYTGEGSASYD